MNIEHFLFLMYLFPTVSGIIYKVRYTSAEIILKRKEKIEKKGKERYLFEMSMLFLLFLIPYYGAYIYADLQYIWLLLAIFYTVLALVSITASGYSWHLKIYNNKKYTEAIEKINAENKGQKESFYPVLRERVNCGIKIFSIILWLYSWRHFYA